MLEHDRYPWIPPEIGRPDGRNHRGEGSGVSRGEGTEHIEVGGRPEGGRDDTFGGPPRAWARLGSALARCRASSRRSRQLWRVEGEGTEHIEVGGRPGGGEIDTFDGPPRALARLGSIWPLVDVTGRYRTQVGLRGQVFAFANGLADVEQRRAALLDDVHHRIA